MTPLIKINGVQIKAPPEAGFKVSRYNLTKSGRVVSGKMTMDLVAKKRRIDLTYDVISGAELQQILDLIDTDVMFFTVSYQDHAGWHDITCYVGEIPNQYFRVHGGWYYKGVQFALIEQ